MTHPMQPEIPDFASRPERPEREANFNDYVLVKITPAGERMWDEEWSETRIVLGPDAGKLERDEEGYSKIQLWELAYVFGSAMYNGNPEPPVEMGFKLPKSIE